MTADDAARRAELERRERRAAEWDAALEARQRDADQRDVDAEQRQSIAAMREQAADKRDQTAHDRDEAAYERDGATDRREARLIQQEIDAELARWNARPDN